MSPKINEKQMLELFASFVLEHEKEESDGKAEELKNRVRDKMGSFQSRFADGALELLKSLEAPTEKTTAGK